MCRPRWRLAASESVGLSLLDCKDEHTALFLDISTVASPVLDSLSLLGENPGDVVLFLALWIFGEEQNVGSCIGPTCGEALIDRLDLMSETWS